MLASLVITVCLIGTAPDEPEQCETFPIPVEMPFFACVGIGGQEAALAWLQEHPFFEFHELRRWTCSTGERA